MGFLNQEKNVMTLTIHGYIVTSISSNCCIPMTYSR